MTRCDPMLEPERYAAEIEGYFQRRKYRISLPRYWWGTKIEIAGPDDMPLFFCEMRPHVRDFFSLYSSGDNAYLLLTVRRHLSFLAIRDSYAVTDQLAGRPLGRLRHRFFTWPLVIDLDVSDPRGKLAARVVEASVLAKFFKLLIARNFDFEAEIVTPAGLGLGRLYVERYGQVGEIYLSDPPSSGLDPRLLLTAAVIALLKARQVIDNAITS